VVVHSHRGEDDAEEIHQDLHRRPCPFPVPECTVGK
jgi:hypothetical protein